MLAQLPFEIVDHIVEYLDFGDIRSIARVCSALQPPAQRRLFKNIRTLPYNDHPDTESILSSPHLLQYSSRLEVERYGSNQQSFVHSLWPHLPMMHCLTSVDMCLDTNECSRALSALENLDSGREIALVGGRLAPDLLISDNPLPIHSLRLCVNASSHKVATRLVQKCSQTLRTLDLFLEDNITPPLPVLPRLNEFCVDTLSYEIDDKLLVSLFPFLYRHPTITRLALRYDFTLATQPPPDLLPNLQFLNAGPTIIQRLIPGRPVSHIRAEYVSKIASLFPGDTLQQPFVSVTTFAITIDDHLPTDILINIIQATPKLRKFTVDWPCYEVSVAFQDLLPALGKCKDMVHIRLSPSRIRTFPVPPWSRGDFVQMVQRVQENGAAGLWIFALNTTLPGIRGGCEAMRVGWLDVPSQPTLRGEWRFYGREPLSFSDIPMSA